MAKSVNLVLHPVTAAKLQTLQSHPRHALLITGPRGSGKGSVAKQLAADIVAAPVDKLTDQPYVRLISNQKEQAIGIDDIRQLEHFLALKVPGEAQRVVIIEDAHLLTGEAQNALLKSLEEPPVRTTIVLTVTGEQDILPTIRSRAASLAVQRPEPATLQEYFKSQGYAPAVVERNQLMSGGLPGLMTALLDADTEHPLVMAAGIARDIVQKSTFERLALVDQLAKQKQTCLDVLAIMQQMAHLALSGAKPSKQWQNILAASYRANEQLAASAQPKSVLTNLMLNL